jgi:hypothetical protein
MVRAAAALALLLGSATLVSYLHWIGKSPTSASAARHLREMKDRVRAPDSVTAVTFPEFLTLPRGRPLEEYAAWEERGVSLEGYVHSLNHSADGDFYLNLTPGHHAQWSDVPNVITEVTPAWHRESPGWRFENLVAALRSHSQGVPSWPGGPRRARLSGWLLYDYPEERSAAARLLPLPPRSPRLTPWEIHPVTRIEVWDDSLGRFVEVPR